MKFLLFLLLSLGVCCEVTSQVLVDDFDNTRIAYYGYRSGTMSVVSNPASSGINTSPHVGSYIRNASVQYDVMRLQVPGFFNDVTDYVTGTRTLTMKVYSPRAGIPIQLSFEDTNKTTGTNYPTGRYLVVSATTTLANQWELLTFRFAYQPDLATSPLGINTILLILNPNSFTGDTYYFDDLKVAEFTQFDLVFNDEFSGNSLDLNKWNIHVMEYNYNNELQYYTARTENVLVSNGSLNLIARRENYGHQQYTSGDINNSGLGSIKYGRVKVRAKVPAGQGLWPAIWMLPDDDTYGGWPASGEIDIMENLGSDVRRVYSSIHFANPDHQFITRNNVGNNIDYSTDFHIYEVAWTPTRINFLVDSVCISSVEKTRPFDQRFYLILNLAVGGDWPGSPNSSTPFPSSFLVDYVRIYSDRVLCNLPATPSITASGATNFCNGNTVTLTSNIAGGYLWSTGEITRSITVSNSGSYSVEAVNSSCTSLPSSAISITVNSIPMNPEITPSGIVSIVQGNSQVLSAPSGFAGYIWSNGATSQTTSVSNANSYTVRVINSSGCTSAISDATIIYVSVASTTWNGSSWSNGVPTSTVDAFVNGNLTVNNSFTAKSLTVNTGNITLNADITVNGNVNTLTNTILGSGKLILGGSVSQSIAGNFTNLRLNNNAGATLPSGVNVFGRLELQVGTLNVGSESLTLGTSATSQATIDDFSVGFSGAISGIYTFQIYFGGVGLAQRQISAPVNGVTLGSLGGACNTYQVWNEPSNSWMPAPSSCANNPVVPGSSVIKTVNSGSVVSYTGTHTSGTVNRSIVRTDAQSNAGIQYGFNAMGNPYPSYIDWSRVRNIAGNTSNSNCAIWIPLGGQYYTISAAGVVSSPLISKYLAPGMGFLMRRNTTAGLANITFNNSIRINNVPTGTREAVLAEQVRIRLSSTATDIKDEVVIYSDEKASANLDDLDAAKMISDEPTAPSMYVVNEENLSISAMPMLTEKGRIVAVEVKASLAGVYRLDAEIASLPYGLGVKVEDAANHVFMPLNAAFTMKAGETKRFSLHFTKGGLSSLSLNIYPNPAKEQFMVNVDAPTHIQVLNSLGQVVISQEVESGSNVINTASLPAGMYTVLAEGYKASSLVVRK